MPTHRNAATVAAELPSFQKPETFRQLATMQAIAGRAAGPFYPELFKIALGTSSFEPASHDWRFKHRA